MPNHQFLLDLWTISLEDEVDQEVPDKCTTVITNNGKLVTHNEDWEENSENIINVVLKTIGKMVVDMENLVAMVWLKREKEKGWIKYNLKKLFVVWQYENRYWFKKSGKSRCAPGNSFWLRTFPWR